MDSGKIIEADGTRHERKYIRVGWHTYNVGLFFVTISTRDKVHYFGSIRDNEMLYTEIGEKMVEAIINLPNHYKDVEIQRWVVMPNHVHIIIKIGSGISSEGVIPFMKRVPITNGSERNRLSSIVGNLKAEVSRYAKNNGLIFMWTPRFYEHIIFDPSKEQAIFDYIDNNIKKWSEKFHE